MTTTLDNDPVVASLAPFASLPDWLAAGMDAVGVGESLERHVAELAGGDLRLLSCSPDRLRAKGSEWLVRYTLSVAEPGEEARDVVLVGKLWPPSRQLADAPGATTNGTRFGEAGWHCFLPEPRLELRVQTRDEALPALPLLVEPAAAAQLLQPMLRAAGYRDATITSCSPVVVRYKPGSRCTVVVGVTYAPDSSGAMPPSPVVLKTHQGDKGEAAWAAMNALWERPLSWRGAVRLAEPLGYLPDERILVQGPVPEERTLKELARQAIAGRSPGMLDDLREELSRTARALAAVHGSGASYGRTATFEDELIEVTEVVDRLSRSVPGLDAAARPLLSHLAELARDEHADPIVPAHHDFRPAQVLLHQGAVGFIDFDGACMAEPALDVGRFRAKLRDIGISALALGRQPLPDGRVNENLSLLDELCDGFLAAYLEHAAVSETRVLMWETCDLLTTMLHAWTKVRLARLEPRLTLLVHQLRTSGLLRNQVAAEAPGRAGRAGAGAPPPAAPSG
jgi:hypothetical protein